MNMKPYLEQLPHTPLNLTDVAIGAPYACKNPSRSNPEGPCEGQNSGAVYIYYGSPNLTEFAEQTAFEVVTLCMCFVRSSQ